MSCARCAGAGAPTVALREDGLMRRDDVRFAVAAREDGLRRVKSLTTRIGAVGVVSSAAIAVGRGCCCVWWGGAPRARGGARPPPGGGGRARRDRERHRQPEPDRTQR